MICSIASIHNRFVVMALRECFINQYHRLLQIRDTPHAIAAGIGIGIFFGITPLFGIKTLAAFLVSWLMRCSKLSAVMAVTSFDLILPLWPMVMRWQYILGYWLLSHPHQLPAKMTLKHFHVDTVLQWKTLKIVWPMILGSLIFALPLALCGYFIALRLIKIYRARPELARTTVDADI